MNAMTKSLQMLIRLFGLVQIILGIAFWTGNLSNLTILHIVVGIVLVAALWILTAVAAKNGAPAGLIAAAAIFGLLGVILGLTQKQILPGQAHWVVEILHLLIGVGIIGLAEGLGGRMKGKHTPALQS